MTHVVNNIDALINGIPEAQPIDPKLSPVNQEANDTTDSSKPIESEEIANVPENESSMDENNKEDVQDAKNTQEEIENEDVKTDEYGNPLPKPKMYTEEEVQRMIRDRLKRGQFRNEQPQPTQQQIDQAKNSGFEYDENSEVSWQQQLETFIENTMQKVREKERTKQQQVALQQAQVEFEEKFQQGMSKYPDFVETVADKPITDSMMMGIRGLNNPAAFIYAASKRFPTELDRISRIADPYQQIAEMGRLHERLSKQKTSSNAPRPVSQDKSDVNEKIPPKVSIDHLIEQDAKSRYKR